MKPKKDAKTSNDRVIDLLETLNLTQSELSLKIGKQPATIYRIVKKEVDPSKTTLKLIADSVGASYDWLLNGTGEMMVPAAGTTEFNWKEEAYNNLKTECDAVKIELNRVWAMLNHLTGGKIPGFLTATKGSGPLSLYLPGVGFSGSLAAQA